MSGTLLTNDMVFGRFEVNRFFDLILERPHLVCNLRIEYALYFPHLFVPDEYVKEVEEIADKASAVIELVDLADNVGKFMIRAPYNWENTFLR